MLMFFCYSFTAIFVPLETAFDDHFHQHQSSGLQWLLKVAPNLVVDIAFLLDIALCFRIGFYREGQLIMDPLEVARHYLNGRCLLDALCTIPFVSFMWFDLLDGDDDGPYDTYHNAPYTLLRSLRLLRLLRVVPSLVRNDAQLVRRTTPRMLSALLRFNPSVLRLVQLLMEVSCTLS